MDPTDSITQWIGSLKHGSEEAAGKIWEKYYEDLVRQAHKKLGSRPRRESDEEDVVQEAFSSFFRAVQAGRFPDLKDREDLWTVLFVIVDRRAKDRLRKELTEKQGGGRVRGESALAAIGEDGAAIGGFVAIADRGVTPESLDDIIAVLQQSFETLEEDTVWLKIAQLKLQGYKNREIADNLDMSLRAVERKLQLIRQQLKEEMA